MGDVKAVGGATAVGTGGTGSQVDVITVQSKESTFQKISERTGIPVSDLKEANPKIKDGQLRQGMTINYPKELLVGDKETSLKQVAERLDIPLSELEKANRENIKDPDKLRPGQAIRLPKDFDKYEHNSHRRPRVKNEVKEDGVKLPVGTIKKEMMEPFSKSQRLTSV